MRMIASVVTHGLYKIVNHISLVYASDEVGSAGPAGDATPETTFDRRASKESYRICILLTILINKFIQYFMLFSYIIIIKNPYISIDFHNNLH